MMQFKLIHDEYKGEVWERYADYLPMGAGYQGGVYVSVTLPPGETLESYREKAGIRIEPFDVPLGIDDPLAEYPYKNKPICIVIPGKSESHLNYRRRIQEIAEQENVAVVGFDLYSMGLSSSHELGPYVAQRSRQYISDIPPADYERTMGRAAAVVANYMTATLGTGRVNIIAHSTGFHAASHMFNTLRPGISIENVVHFEPFAKPRVFKDLGALGTVELTDISLAFNSLLSGWHDENDVHISQLKYCRPIDETWTEEDIQTYITPLGWDRAHFDYLQHLFRKGGPYENGQKVYATWGWIEGATHCAAGLRSTQGYQDAADRMMERGVKTLVYFADPGDEVVSGSAIAGLARRTERYIKGKDAQTAVHLVQVPGHGHGFHHQRRFDGIYAAAFRGDVEAMRAIISRPAPAPAVSFGADAPPQPA